MKIVVIASEAVPFAKTGGLADVAGALPRALADLGHEATLILPCYNQVWRSGLSIRDLGVTLQVPVGPRRIEARLQAATLPGSTVPVYLIGQPAYFEREGLYGWRGGDFADNAERFAFFSRAAIEAIRQLHLRPDVVHCNDWQTGLIPIYLKEFYNDLRSTGTLLTIHNMGYQGAFPRDAFPITGLHDYFLDWQRLEFHGQVNYLKAGLVYADLLNTVSPTYAREIQTPEFGCGLDGLLRARSADLRGIVNGIDTSVWDPETDPKLSARYSRSALLPGKAECKAFLQRRANLPERPDVPLFAQIGRLDQQKGWDILARPHAQRGWDWIAGAADVLLNGDAQLVVLGTGQPVYHELLGRLAMQHPGKLRAFLEFSDPLAHQIEAGADFFLMPSLYEPCGLNQLYSLAYGTVPIVRRTGGLADTVRDATPAAIADGTATGFVFHEDAPPDAPANVLQDARERAMTQAIERALDLAKAPAMWRKVIEQGMSQDWSWKHSALEYVQLYEDVIRRRRGQ